MTVPETARLTLGIPGFTFEDLHSPERLRDLDAFFLSELAREDADTARVLAEARRDPDALADSAHSDLLVRLAPRVSEFLARVFPVGQ
ncbi:MAG TPA: hypothetical protein VFL12_10800, partial [Thermoanaerobaculia bacterium]|nr:hypothetical protein [Thermoanaerobaculia bacterium]